MATDSSGRLFAANFNAGTVRSFTITTGNPVAATGSPFTATGLATASHGLAHPAGFYLVTNRNTGNIAVFQIAGSGAGTTMTQVSGSPFTSGGTSPEHLVLNDSGTIVFAANATSLNVTSYSINSTSGALTPLVTQTSGTAGLTGRISGMAYTTVTIPPPVVTTSHPVVTITGRKVFTTRVATVTIKGKASVTDGSVASVSVKQDNRLKAAKGTTNWSFTAKLKRGKNRFTITALGSNGLTSAPVRVTITRK
jgi:hypothetical protein